jgi:hypothetical protein
MQRKLQVHRSRSGCTKMCLSHILDRFCSVLSFVSETAERKKTRRQLFGLGVGFMVGFGFGIFAVCLSYM